KNSSALGEITRIVTGVSIIVTADSKENPGIGHVRLESPVTLGWNTQRPRLTTGAPEKSQKRRNRAGIIVSIPRTQKPL
ncbi:hypothetical protein, partial [Thiolapillus sp.]|uniref:hypothetical protein n=1 Tax=Thiolapillus sp. TaxID=2017437 RepID=UPI003AF8538F